MYVIIKLDVLRSENTIISIKPTYECSLNTLNDHIKNVHDSNKSITYLENNKERVAVYQRGLVYGKTLLFCYQILHYDELLDCGEN